MYLQGILFILELKILCKLIP